LVVGEGAVGVFEGTEHQGGLGVEGSGEEEE
jgi:hypothetical protein